MARVRGATASLAMVLLSNVAILAEAIPNWSAPRSWTPPRTAALQNLEKARGVSPLAIESLPTGPLPFVAISPCRLVDTRPSQGFTGAYGPPILLANAIRTFDLNSAPQCPGIPSTAQAYSLMFAVTETTGAPGDVRVFPTGQPVTNTSVLNWNFVGSAAIANTVIIAAGTNGSIDVLVAGFNTHLVIDINGYYASPVAATAKTVSVDCTQAQSIQAVINAEAGPLVVEIHGICQENVLVKQREITLRGADPNTDGIQGVVPQVPAVQFRYVDPGKIENLSISNGLGIGFSAVVSRVELLNSRIIGNGGDGISLNTTNAIATGLTVSQNQTWGARVGTASFFLCAECEFQGNQGFAAGAVNGGFLTLHDTVVTGVNGLTSSGNSYADLDCLTTESAHPCSLAATGRAARAFGNGTAAIYGNVDFTGQVASSDRGIIQLIGARQLATGQPGQGPSANSVSDLGRLSAGPDELDNQSQLFGTTNVSGFGRVILYEATTLAGTIQCGSAGDAWLDPTVIANPGSAVTGCEHGALPP